MKKLTLFFTFLAVTWIGKAQNLIINELMQSNVDCIMDDLNEFPDSWVELYNPTEDTINLKDYKIGSKKKVEKAWQLPDSAVAAHDYVIIYCDKAGEDAGVSAMHTDFRLETSKESKLYLFKNDVAVDWLESIAEQPAPNIAYGRLTEGADEWGYQATPTPGASNCDSILTQVLGAPVFGTPGQVFISPDSISLTLSLPEGAPQGTQIRYTTDGSEPVQTSTLYTDTIGITENTVVRAKLFCDGYLSPRSTCHSYIFFPNDRELTLSVISLTTDNKFLYDPKIGILVKGTYSPDKVNYKYDWRRPINIEFFETEGDTSVINQLCETRIGGNGSRKRKRKTMIIYANKRFGTKRLDYEFFPDQKPGLHEFKSIMLRNSGNDFHYLYMRDAIIQRTMASHVDVDWQAWRPAIIYINGEYRGLLNIRERSNEDNIYTNYDGLEDIDLIQNRTLKEGTIDNFKDFIAFYEESGHTLAEYAQWMDIEEYMNLMIGNMYYNNLDFLGNNMALWRPRTEDGKWRWIMKDTDFGLGYDNRPPTYNMVEWIYTPGYDASADWGNLRKYTIQFRHLMEDPDFKREFLDRAAIYMGDFLNEKGTRAIWDPMYEMIRTEYPYHAVLVNHTWAEYEEELDYARTWLSERTNHFYNHLADFYKWGTPTPLTVNTKDSFNIVLNVNGIQLSGNIFDGKYYAGRTITVNAQCNDEDFEVTGWILAGAINQEVYSSELTVSMPTDSLDITPILTAVSDLPHEIQMVEIEGTTKEDNSIYDLLGNKVQTPSPGNIYIQNKKKFIFW